MNHNCQRKEKPQALPRLQKYEARRKRKDTKESRRHVYCRRLSSQSCFYGSGNKLPQLCGGINLRYRKINSVNFFVL